MDIDPRHKPDIVADNTNMPLDDASYDVIVYDPPHIPNQGSDKKKDFGMRFGLVLRLIEGEPLHVYSHIPAVRA